MSLSLRRIAGSIGILAAAAAAAAAAYPSLREGTLAQQEERMAGEFEQRLAQEAMAQLQVRHVGELFPHGR